MGPSYLNMGLLFFLAVVIVNSSSQTVNCGDTEASSTTICSDSAKVVITVNNQPVCGQLGDIRSQLEQLQMAVSDLNTRFIIANGCSIETPLGMESGDIPDERITASTFWLNNPVHAPIKARLNNIGVAGAWCITGGDAHPWIQVDFNVKVYVIGLITQGRNSRDGYPQWVTEYNVQYSDDGLQWNDLTNADGTTTAFTGNTDGDTQVTTRFGMVLFTRFVRILPTSWNTSCCMRFEVIGCRR